MSQDRNQEYHIPVMAKEVAELIGPVLPGVVIDATFGGGGHSRFLLDEFGENLRIVGIDRDPEAVANGADLGVEVVLGNFSSVDVVAKQLDLGEVDAVLFDFGISSHQVDEAARGFSYRLEGPLDMRMGPDSQITAGHLINQWDVKEIARIIRTYGEDPLATRIARAIVAGRPFSSTSQVAAVVAQAVPATRRRAGHPARRTFQAIRIAVNDELRHIEVGLDRALEVLRPGGRLVTIAYHSLEDRIVKRRFAAGAHGCTCPPELPVCGCGQSDEFRLLTRGGVKASSAEVEANNRARSAILRSVEKVAG